MIEPMRELLDAGVASDRVEHDERWVPGAQGRDRRCRSGAEHDARPRQDHHAAAARDCKRGDILPCDFSGRATVLAEEVPVFRGKFGVSHGQQAVQIEERVARSKPKADDRDLDP